MTGEAIPHTGVVPTDIERESIYDLIAREEEDLDIKSGDSGDSLHAMIAVSNRYGFGLSPAAKKHLRKMIVIHSQLLYIDKDESAFLPSTLRSVMGVEFSEFEGFSEDLSNMTEPWREAMHDVSLLVGDPDEGKKE